jgi:hypothetical protein
VVLGKVFGPKTEEVRGGWRKLRTEELYNLFSPLNIIKVRILERWDGVMWTGLVWLRIGTGGELL